MSGWDWLLLVLILAFGLIPFFIDMVREYREYEPQDGGDLND